MPDDLRDVVPWHLDVADPGRWPALPEGLLPRCRVVWGYLSPEWAGVVASCWTQAGRERGGRPAMFGAPAAPAGRHHGYLGGLIEHTLEVAEIALVLAQQPANAGRVDLGLLVAGALLHDVGKTWTYQWQEDGGGCRRSPLGRQITHVGLGLAMLRSVLYRRAQEEAPGGLGLPDTTQLAELVDIVRCHHGVPRAPRSLEGLMVQMADTTSAALAVVRGDPPAAVRQAVGRGLGASFLWARVVRRGRGWWAARAARGALE